MASYGSVAAPTADAAANGTPDESCSSSAVAEGTPLISGKKDVSSSPQEQSSNSSTTIITDSIWSRLTFGWFIPILEIGNEQNQLQPEDMDLVTLPTDCSTDDVSKRFQYYWKIQLEQHRSQQNNTTSTSSPATNTGSSFFAAPSMVIALAQSFGLDFLKAGFLKLIHDLCIFVGPQVLNGLVYFLRDADAPLSRGLFLTVLVTLSQLTMSLCLRHYFYKCYKTGLRIRSAVVVAVYQKALVLDSSERLVRSTGEITNLMSIDAQRMQELTTYLHAIWYSFVQIGLALFFLWKQLGASSLGGVVVICVMIPTTKAVAQWLGGIQKRLMKARDDRVEMNTEIVGSMKVIKFQAWEESFQERLLHLRQVELEKLWRYIIAQSLSIMLWSATPLAVALATFAAYILSGHKLDVASALTALALFDILRFPLFMLPQIINRIVDAGVSITRIQTFLLCKEYSKVPSNTSSSGSQNGLAADAADVAAVNIDRGTFCYESRKPRPDTSGVEPDALTKTLFDKEWEIQLLRSQLQDVERNLQNLTTRTTSTATAAAETVIVEEPDNEAADHQHLMPDLLCLKRIDFKCRQGELVAVVGGVGCGKSSLINSMLGEVRRLSGTTNVNGKLSYFAQTPFILNDTVRNNILFSHVDEPVDEELYQRALSCCALRHDLHLLPAGDKTEIGEKGITLSGGQKARVALARAVYHQSDISLLDDPLAAVDAHVGKHIFQRCIVNELLTPNKGDTTKRSVIFVTNALHFLSNPRVDRIVVLRDGRIVEQGTYNELARDGKSLFSRYIDIMNETGVSPTTTEGCDLESVPGLSLTTEEVDTLQGDDLGDDFIPLSEESERSKKEETISGALMTDELKERAVGHVGKEIYVAWGKAAGGIYVPFLVMGAYAAVEVLNVMSKWWLTYWSNHGDERSQIFFLAIYAAINLSTIVATFFRLVIVMTCGLRASRKIFVRLLGAIIHAPMSFFDTTPIGRIINRFSKDMYTIDEQLVAALRSYLMTLSSIFSTVIVISSVTPIFMLCLIPMFAFYACQQAYFTVSYRELKRLDSIARSPIYALLGETLDGVATIRAHDAQTTLSNRLTSMLDSQQHAYFLISTAQCWLAIRLEFVGTMIVTFACLSSVLQHGTKGGDDTFAGLAGLAISYSLSVTQSLNWSVRVGSDLEAAMVAVERSEQYSSLHSEAPRFTDTDSELEGWPQRGEIEFVSSKLRYRPGLPLVLKDLKIRIPAGAKVGVVGRTGAGKSTLMIALLRVVELAEGKILIDGVDHSKIGLAKLRSKIAVIPQDPVLFSGTIRTNLDPFEDYSDDRLLEVLNRVGLYSPATTTTTPSSSMTSLASLGGKIQSLRDVVAEGGSNYSVGQRQLLVIARALLCGANIVIMDEATASVDSETDARIQKCIRQDFAHATCLTVAHRINTILDSDYILVMNDGKAAEFESPKVLLDRGGLFADLVAAAAHEAD